MLVQYCHFTQWADAQDMKQCGAGAPLPPDAAPSSCGRRSDPTNPVCMSVVVPDCSFVNTAAGADELVVSVASLRPTDSVLVTRSNFSHARAP